MLKKSSVSKLLTATVHSFKFIDVSPFAQEGQSRLKLLLV